MDRTQLKLHMHVILNEDYNHIPKGTKGKLVSICAKPCWPKTDRVAIQWKRYEGDTLVYYFSYKQLEYLDEVPTTTD